MLSRTTNKWRYAVVILTIIYTIIHIVVLSFFLNTLNNFNTINDAPSIGPGLALIAIEEYMLLPLGVIDAILILLYPVVKLPKGKPKAVGYGMWLIISLIILRFTYNYLIGAVLVWIH